MPDPFRELRDALRDFAAERDWDQFHTPRNLATALDDTQAEHLAPATRAAVEEEMADVLLYLIRLADKLEVDLERAARAKILRNAEKYPVERVRGSSRKYDQF
jgi:NTP pyrophosphatase (non-canonical NTP hydrolase)